MIHPVSSHSRTSAPNPVHSKQPTQTPPAHKETKAPQDTVELSSAAKAAKAATGDTGHDGHSH